MLLIRRVIPKPANTKHTKASIKAHTYILELYFAYTYIQINPAITFVATFFFVKIYLQRATHSFALLFTYVHTHTHTLLYVDVYQRHLCKCICFICYFSCTFAMPPMLLTVVRWPRPTANNQAPSTKWQSHSQHIASVVAFAFAFAVCRLP